MSSKGAVFVSPARDVSTAIPSVIVHSKPGSNQLKLKVQNKKRNNCPISSTNLSSGNKICASNGDLGASR
jgi:hypothetical protein